MIINHANKNYKVDGNQITFLDSRFYESDGVFVPSVTTILEAYPKGAEYFAWLKKVGEDADRVRDEAGRRGSRVHALTELLDKGEKVSLVDELGNITMKLNEWSMVERYVEFRTRFNYDIRDIELTSVSLNLGFAGTLDRIFTVDGKNILVDIKTSNAIYPSYWLQLAAYEKLMNERGVIIDDAAILWLNAKTRTEGKKGDIRGIGWQLITRKEGREKDWQLFQATHKLWLAENENSRPKLLSYQLSHNLNIK